MNDQVIRYGVVGLGRAGWDIHIKALRELKGAKVVAAVDPDEARRKQALDELGAKGYASLGEMLKDEDVDVAVIATPSAAHVSDSLAALRAGKHVVVEKPMATNLAQADEVIREAEKLGRKLFVHHNQRFSAEFNHLADVIASGKIGRLFHVRYNFHTFARRNDWQTLAKNGGGLLNNHATHAIDAVVQLLGGKISRAMGDLQQIASAGDVEDHIAALLIAENGCTAAMELSTAEAIAAPLPKWILCGTTGTLTSDGKASTLKWFDPKLAPPLKVVEGAVANRKYGNDDKLPWQEETMPAEGRDRSGFYDNVEAVLNRGEKMRVTPQSAREVLRVIDAIRQGTKFPG